MSCPRCMEASGLCKDCENYHFRREYLCQPAREDNPYVLAWLAYHKAADAIDGHLLPNDRSLVGTAMKSGFSAMRNVLNGFNLEQPKWDDVQWQAAKQEALWRRR